MRRPNLEASKPVQACTQQRNVRGAISWPDARRRNAPVTSQHLQRTWLLMTTTKTRERESQGSCRQRNGTAPKRLTQFSQKAEMVLVACACVVVRFGDGDV
jgi:hypothetical protein